MPLRLLVVSSETPDQQDERRRRSGMASHETYAETLRQMAGDVTIETTSCVDARSDLPPHFLSTFDGIVFSGSPIQMHEDTPEVRQATAFMDSVYQTATPSFGSCAGLQIAAVAAGGTVKTRDAAMNAGFTRGIVASDAGRRHPMLEGRPGSWDAPTMHSAMVDKMPKGGTVLASSKQVPVEAAEIRSGSGVFWGVQYHPELALTEIADALRGQTSSLVEQGLAHDDTVVDRYATDLETLEETRDSRDLAWQLGLDAEVIDVRKRRLEIASFLRWIRDA